jgi:hypothetical protein
VDERTIASAASGETVVARTDEARASSVPLSPVQRATLESSSLPDPGGGTSAPLAGIPGDLS